MILLRLIDGGFGGLIGVAEGSPRMVVAVW